MEESKYIDHTLLKACATKEDIKKLCEEAILHNFKSVCVNPCHVMYASELLRNTGVLVCTVVGFPLGANHTKVKAFETKQAILDGANEIDMVINVGKVKEKDYQYVLNDILAVVLEAGSTLVKVILETCYLTDEEIKQVCLIAKRAKAQFVKTSTGFGTGGATISHVELMKSTVKDSLEVKASGGIKTKEDFDKMIKAGATRIGTSSGANIIGGKNDDSNTAY